MNFSDPSFYLTTSGKGQSSRVFEVGAVTPPRPRESRSRPEKRRPDYKKSLDAKSSRHRRTTTSVKRRGGLRRQQKVSRGRRTTVKAGSAAAQAPARVALLAFYEKHNPSKLNCVDETLARYQGKETKLFAALCKKYSVDPSQLVAIENAPYHTFSFGTAATKEWKTFNSFPVATFPGSFTSSSGRTGRSTINSLRTWSGEARAPKEDDDDDDDDDDGMDCE
mmetsp:Transcript_2025/g.4853  ORF Transcript_2025/g.4853 Transcript_2025/m.4853 type:complete len:222 (-) Transcript_2025:1389-2054(-)